MQVKSISDGLLFSTVRIETFPDSGPGTISTGFVFEFQAGDNRYPFLVTSKHTISGAANGRITFVQEQRGQPALSKGYTLDIENFEQLWYPHPDDEVDCTVTPFVPFVKHIEDSGIPIYFRSISDEFALQRAQLQQMGVLDEVIFVGYPSGVCDEKNLLPILCRGVTATPVSLDFNAQQQFIITAPLYPGCSGSPVYLLQNVNEGEQHRRLVLLGLITSGYCQCPKMAKDKLVGYKQTPVAEIYRQAPGESVNFGVVLKVHAVIDLIKAYLQEKEFL